jgi:DNA-binding winged helix-turn-helix (wHTH) protein
MNRELKFPPFHLDLDDQLLWKSDQPIKLRPKTFDVLAHLVAHAPSLVTQEALLAAVWGDELSIRDGGACRSGEPRRGS